MRTVVVEGNLNRRRLAQDVGGFVLNEDRFFWENRTARGLPKTLAGSKNEDRSFDRNLNRWRLAQDAGGFLKMRTALFFG